VEIHLGTEVAILVKDVVANVVEETLILGTLTGLQG
jgi:hypothetical protein